MKQIIDDIKQQIKEKKAELAQLEKALTALSGDKPAPKAKSVSSASSQKTVPTGSSTPTEPLPDRILKYLANFDDISADQLAEELKAPVNQVRTTCSRMVREGRLTVNKIGKTALYSVAKAAETKTENPFEGQN